MIKTNIYRYLGRNGMITTPIILEGATAIPMYRLTADENKKLTNGVIQVSQIDVFEDELDNWYEISIEADNN